MPDKPLKILAVDDDEGILILIRRKLKKRNYLVEGATDTDGAVDKLKSNSFNMMILDYYLGGEDCLAILDYAEENDLNIPFIIMTGHGDERLAVKMMKMGAKDYLVKDSAFFDLMPAVVERAEKQILIEQRLKESESKLIESENKYQNLYLTSTDAVFFTNADHKFEEVNPSFSKLFGIESEGLSDISIESMFVNRNLSEEFLRDLENTGAVHDFEALLKTRSGKKIECLIRANLRKTSSEKFAGAQGIIRNVTEQNENERTILKLNEDLERRVKARTLQLEEALDELKFENEERKKTEAQLEEAKQKLADSLSEEKELSKLKTRFLSMISREYRTPLTVMMSSIYILDEYFKRGDTENFAAQLAKIQASARNLTDMLDDLLDVEKAKSGDIEAKPYKIDIYPIIRDCVESATKRHDNSRETKIESNSEKCEVEADPQLFRRAFENLLSNAYKFSESQNPVIVRVDGDSQKVSVVDRGVGIPEKYLDRIFDPFVRADNAADYPGAGLGLSIVKNNLELFGAKIEATSEIDRGSEFTIKFKKSD